MTPDAWDECGGCGHDRDDHDDGIAACMPGGVNGGCDCIAFVEPS